MNESKKNLSKILDLTRKLYEMVHKLDESLDEKEIERFNEILDLRESVIKELEISGNVEEMERIRLEIQKYEKRLIEKLEKIKARVLMDMDVNSRVLKMTKKYGDIIKGDMKFPSSKFNKEA